MREIALVALYAALLLANALIFVGLPGGWIAFAVILIHSIATRFGSAGWPVLLLMAGLLVAGEIVESFLGIVYVSRKGATRWGVFGAFAGGIAGAVVGTMIVPVVGSILFAFVGAFAGAVLLEYARYRSLDRALQTGFFAFVGKLLATAVKFALGLAVLGLFIYRSW